MFRAVLVAAIACVSCTYDFDSYLPNLPNGSDAAVDTACTPDGGDACYGTARSCAGTCQGQRSTCESACTNPGCRKTCRDAETSCKSSCTSACTACTTSGGCATPSRCASEVG